MIPANSRGLRKIYAEWAGDVDLPEVATFFGGDECEAEANAGLDAEGADAVGEAPESGEGVVAGYQDIHRFVTRTRLLPAGYSFDCEIERPA